MKTLSDKVGRRSAPKRKKPVDGYKRWRVRDLSMLELNEELWMVVACDSDGGIGPKKLDSVFSPAYDVGRLGTRVPLMEVLASGAFPVSVVDALAVEMEPTGKEIIHGGKDEVAESGLDADLAVTGSTEDNVATVSTGIGVVVIGLVNKSEFKPGTSLDGDAVVSVGIPKSAPEFKVTYNDPDIATPAIVRKLVSLPYVHDILPVGSKGIRYELNEMARTAGLATRYVDPLRVDVDRSGGPSTCCLVSLPADKVTALKKEITQPVSIIGELYK